MIAIQLALVWAGYTLTWWGYGLIKGKSVGLADLINPKAVSKVDAAFGSDIAAKFTGAAAPSSSPIAGMAAAPSTDVQAPALAPLSSQQGGSDLTRIGRAN